MKQPKVYVSQENPRLDYTDAQRFGQLKFLTAFGQNFPKYEGSHFAGPLIDNLEMALEDFDHEKDFLLLSGCPVLLGIVSYFVYSKNINGKHVNLLQWSQHSQGYQVVKVRV